MTTPEREGRESDIDWPPKEIRYGVYVHPSGRRTNWRYKLRNKRLGVKPRPHGGQGCRWVWPTVERC